MILWLHCGYSVHNLGSIGSGGGKGDAGTKDTPHGSNLGVGGYDGVL